MEYACVKERPLFDSHPVEIEDGGLSWSETDKLLKDARSLLKEVTVKEVSVWLSAQSSILRSYRVMSVKEKRKGEVHVLLMNSNGFGTKHVVVTKQGAKVVGRISEYDAYSL